MGELFSDVLHDITADPARFAAEVVQSLFLLAVLGWAGRRYLVRRLAARREAIAAELAGADTAERESARLRQEAAEVGTRAEQESPAIVQAARARADQEREASIARIEGEAREIVALARQNVERDLERVRREASARLVRFTAEAARRYLDEMLSEDERRALIQKAILETLEEFAPGSPPPDVGVA